MAERKKILLTAIANVQELGAGEYYLRVCPTFGCEIVVYAGAGRWLQESGEPRYVDPATDHLFLLPRRTSEVEALLRSYDGLLQQVTLLEDARDTASAEFAARLAAVSPLQPVGGSNGIEIEG